MADRLLHKTLSSQKDIYGDDFFKERAPRIIYDNIRPDFGERPYQKEAFGRFSFYWEDFQNKPEEQAVQLLYHMATGSGKTLIMAGLIIYLYEKGYRNFLFFVNSANIIDKTRENFLNPTSTKYLFAQSLQIGDQQINIQEVDNFSAANPDDINIVFTTIQGLHSRLNTPRENSITFEDFEDEKIVLISDEAHHINAETKTQSQRLKSEERNLNTWEGTVSSIVNAHPDNVMLEFTATMDLGHKEIREKYEDRILFDYPLKEFRVDGYSKEVQVLKADLDPFGRALQALLLSQYRRKVFEKYGKLIKPVILFKSKTINESETFYNEFQKKLNDLSVGQLKTIKNNTNLDDALHEVFEYLDNERISLENFIHELKEDFSEDKCLTVNSKSESEEKQIAVNTLEDPDNEYRGIFAVNKLNEGWDVLNLFDIVRLYDTRGSRRGKPGKTTMSEAQLIGRGARYCPFQLDDEQPMYQRKYDVRGDKEEHDLKICEELYYHSKNNPKYIQELKKALKEVGIIPDHSTKQQLELKDSFKQTELYQSGKIFVNERKKYKREDVDKLDEDVTQTPITVSFHTGYSSTDTIFEDDDQGVTFATDAIDIRLDTIESRIIRKAIQRLDFYQFDNLKKYFPNLKSIKEFISSEDYLEQLNVHVQGPKKLLQNLQTGDELYIVVDLLDQISAKIKSVTVEYEGTKEFKPKVLSEIITNKTLNIARDDGGDSEYGLGQTKTENQDLYLNLEAIDWYAFNDNYGTSEEKRFVKYIHQTYDALEDKYDEVYLVRNEKHFKIYGFDDGQAFEPDFVLFLIGNKDKPDVHYQIFIEPKGDIYITNDIWKEKFLLRLKEEHKVDQLWKGKDYIIWGMPFYNKEKRSRKFDEEFSNVLE
jgi:type III restriction enzyme